MLQRIFFIASLTFAFSIFALIATGVGLFLAGTSGWDEFVLEHTTVDILSIQPSCLRITNMGQLEGTNFRVENRCGGNIHLERQPSVYDAGKTAEEQLSSALSSREYEMLNSGYRHPFMLKWQVRGSVGDEPLLISGRTRADILRILNLLNYFLIPVSFYVAAVLGIVNLIFYVRKKHS